MIIDGLKIMFIGMVVVFIMLYLIIVSTEISSRIIRRFEKNVETKKEPAAYEGEKSNIIAVISAAITRFRNGK